MFGQWGGFILQVTTTVAVILGLIAVVYWLVRRYSGGGLGRLSRSRVARLAVIDAMPVDSRRRLVLVRRDNVEHLILLGGPTDVVVEQSIQRPRQRPVTRPQAVGSPAEVPAQPEPESAHPENAPIPFPQSRIHQPAPHQAAPVAERSYAPVRRASQPQPVRAEPVNTSMSVAPPFVAAAELSPVFPEAATESPVHEPRAYAPTNGGGPPLRTDFSNGSSPAPAASPFAAPPDLDTATKVNDLEREMARLLGEITAKHP